MTANVLFYVSVNKKVREVPLACASQTDGEGVLNLSILVNNLYIFTGMKIQNTIPPKDVFNLVVKKPKGTRQCK